MTTFQGMRPQNMILRGYRAIAKALGVADRASVSERAHRTFDPLRLRKNAVTGSVYIYRDRLVDWIARDDALRAGLAFDPSIPRIQGTTDLCAALDGIGVVTLYALAKLPHDPLPIQGIGTRKPWAYTSALRDWIEGHDTPLQTSPPATRTKRRKSRAKARKVDFPDRKKHPTHKVERSIKKQPPRRQSATPDPHIALS